MSVKIDWLTLTICGTLKTHPDIEVKHTEYKTRHFNKIANVFYKGQKFGVLTYEPHSSILKPNVGNFKIENYVLYQKDFHTLTQRLINDLGFVIIGISRLDLCNDFNTFADKVHPQIFIKRFLSGYYQKNGRGHFSLEGNQTKLGNEYQTLKFGNHGGKKSVYLYNKTLEMENNFKGHIQDSWIENGLDVKDVWRLECSLKLSRGHKLDLETGEVVELTWTKLKDQLFLQQIYRSIIQTNFGFKRKTTDTNKSRNPDVVLFNSWDAKKKYKIVECFSGAKNGRGEKVLVKKLDELQKVKHIHEHEKEAIQVIKEKVIRENALEDWYLRKCDLKFFEEINHVRIESFARLHQSSVYQSYRKRVNHLSIKKSAYVPAN